jgi:hypothetical protein
LRPQEASHRPFSVFLLCHKYTQEMGEPVLTFHCPDLRQRQQPELVAVPNKMFRLLSTDTNSNATQIIYHRTTKATDNEGTEAASTLLQVVSTHLKPQFATP